MSFATPDIMRGAPGKTTQFHAQSIPVRGFDATMQSRMALQTLNLQNNISEQKNILGNFSVPYSTGLSSLQCSLVQPIGAQAVGPPTLGAMGYSTLGPLHLGSQYASEFTCPSVMMTEAQSSSIQSELQPPAQSTDISTRSETKVYKNTRDMADQLFKPKADNNSFERMAHETFANHKLGFEHLNHNLKELKADHNVVSSGLATQASLMNNMHEESKQLQAELKHFKDELKQLRAMDAKQHSGLMHHTEAFAKLNNKIELNHYTSTDHYTELQDRIDNLETALQAHSECLQNHETQIKHKLSQSQTFNLVPDVKALAPNRRK